MRKRKLPEIVRIVLKKAVDEQLEQARELVKTAEIRNRQPKLFQNAELMEMYGGSIKTHISNAETLLNFIEDPEGYLTKDQVSAKMRELQLRDKINPAK